MKLVVLPDLHERSSALCQLKNVLERADFVLLPGDLANGNGARGAARVIDEVREFNPRVLAIPGNWDDLATSQLMTQQGINLHCRHVIHNGCAFAGVGGALSNRRSDAHGRGEQQLAADLERAVAGLDSSLPLVLICHQPPINTRADFAHSKKHVGSVAVRAFIERVQPLVCFTGHIHESVGIDKIGQTLVINAGPIWEGWYGTAEITGHHAQVHCHRILPRSIET